MADIGALVVSLDLELLWGTHDQRLNETKIRQANETRAAVRCLLGLFARYEVRATWAIIGHLFLEQAERDSGGRPHPAHPRPRHAWVTGDWFQRLPLGDAKTCPCWYAPDLIDFIRAASPTHEIASHSFSHVIFGDSGCDERVAHAEVKASVEAASRAGIRLRSFVFPRNRVGHLGVLRELGFEVFRDLDANYYWKIRAPFRKPLHFLDRLLALTPPAVLPRLTKEGLIALPASMLFLSRDGWGKYIPLLSRVVQAKRGLRRLSGRRRSSTCGFIQRRWPPDDPNLFFARWRRFLRKRIGIAATTNSAS